MSNVEIHTYDRICIQERDENFTEDEVMGSRAIRNFMELRKKYTGEPRNQFQTKLESPHRATAVHMNEDISEPKLEFEKGVYQVNWDASEHSLKKIPSQEEFQIELQKLWSFCNGKAQTFCYKRLHILEKKYELHILMNSDIEQDGLKHDPVDFFSITKIDNHIHAAAMMTAPQLLNFIKRQLSGSESLEALNGKSVKEYIKEEVGIDEELLSVDSLDVQGDYSVFHRFDQFNKHYNPFGKESLRNLFLKTDGIGAGKFLRELLTEVINETEKAGHNVLLEPRLSIYGKSEKEWVTLAAWLAQDDGNGVLLHCEQIRWMIQFPRIFAHFKKQDVENFEAYLKNIFHPLFQVSINPDHSDYPGVAEMLSHIVGFDSVDDESAFDELLDSSLTLPVDWSVGKGSPPYSYFAYYFWANITSLNHLRQAKGLNTFSFRPHAGEAGQVHHLATTFLLADSINHGIMLKESQPLSYLYYLAQIGISMSPLSNNALFLPLDKSPFKKFHAIGMNITLSTDDPLQFHNTAEPLIEEYTIAKQLFKLSSTDVAEVAARSVHQSGWSHDDKCKMLGERYFLHGAQGNDVAKSNIPGCRSSFRYNCLLDEFRTIWNASEENKKHWNEIDLEQSQLHNEVLQEPVESPQKKRRANPKEAVADGIENHHRLPKAALDWQQFTSHLKAATLWKASKPYYNENKIPKHLTFKEGDVIVIFPKAFSGNEKEVGVCDCHCMPAPVGQAEINPPTHEQNQSTDLEPNKYWYGRDKEKHEGWFPFDHGKIIQHGKHVTYHSVLKFI